MRRAFFWLVRGYQLTFSAMFGRTCRFEPTCSHYVQEAVEKHGFVRGLGLGLRRLARCHPWGGSGVDFVPKHLKKGR